MRRKQRKLPVVGANVDHSPVSTPERNVFVLDRRRNPEAQAATVERHPREASQLANAAKTLRPRGSLVAVHREVWRARVSALRPVTSAL